MFIFCLSFIDDIDDKKLFEYLFDSYRKQMLYLAMSFVHNQADAEDIVHDVFLSIAQKHISTIKTFENEADVRGYLLKATKNTALNKIRDKKRTCVDLSDISELSSDSIQDSDFIETICNKFEYRQIISAIRSLDEIYRNSLYYHFVLELPVKQVAKMLHQSVSTTKTQLVRGKKILLSLIKLKGE